MKTTSINQKLKSAKYSVLIKVRLLLKRTVISLSVIIACTQLVTASPWIGTNHASLHNDLKTLVEYGYINSISMTYPLPWQTITSQLKNIQIKPEHRAADIALNRLTNQLRRRAYVQSQMSIKAANEPPRTTSFENKQVKKGEFNFNTRLESDSFAAQLSVNAESDGEEHFEGSYAAYRVGLWQFYASAINQWWGPGESTSLILTNNAQAVPSLGILTSQPAAAEESWLSYLGPWYLSAQLGKLESNRFVPNAKLWKARFNFKPTDNFEVGLSWSAMWGGEGYGNGFSDFIDVITFRAVCVDGTDNCDEELHTKPGNHLAGVDLKYTFSMFGQPANFYAQAIGEDAKDFYMITDRVYLFGLSTYLWDSKVYIETSDTTVSCGSATSTTNNCFYEHSDYRSGYRHFGRVMGSNYDSDAFVTSFGLKKHFDDGDELEIKLDLAELNADGQKPSPIINGNSEDLIRLQTAYVGQFDNWRLKLGVAIESTDYEPTNGAPEYDGDQVFFGELIYEF